MDQIIPTRSSQIVGLVSPRREQLALITLPVSDSEGGVATERPVARGPNDWTVRRHASRNIRNSSSASVICYYAIRLSVLKMALSEEFIKINQLYDECLDYLTSSKCIHGESTDDVLQEVNEESNAVYDDNDVLDTDDDYDEIQPKDDDHIPGKNYDVSFKVIDELKSNGSTNSLPGETKSERLRRLSQQLPKIVITQSNTSLSLRPEERKPILVEPPPKIVVKKPISDCHKSTTK